MEVGIDGMLANETKKKSASILRKFLLFNLAVFSILGLFHYFLLKSYSTKFSKKKQLITTP